MQDFLNTVLYSVPDDMEGTAKTPGTPNLFKIRDDQPLLNDNIRELFHTIIVKLLFLCKRGRPDIQTAIAFLCTRVKCADNEDYLKLARVIKYLRHTKDLVLRLRAENLNIIKWWIGGAFGVHVDMLGHTRGFL